VFTDVVEASAMKRDASLGRDSYEQDQNYLGKIQAPRYQNSALLAIYRLCED
jgi:hypothetical protein